MKTKLPFLAAFRRLLVAAGLLLAAFHYAAAETATPGPDQVPQGLNKPDWASIRAAYEAGRHAFQPVPGQDGVWQARNPGQQWTTKFDGQVKAQLSNL